MISIELAGTFTVIALVVLGIFIYPWLLGKRGGAWVIALVTLTLALAYFFLIVVVLPPWLAAALALLWALTPVIAGVITRRTRGTPKKS